MAIGFPNSAAALTRTAAYLDRAQSWTRFMWARQGSTTPSAGGFRIYLNDGDTLNTDPYVYLGSPPDSYTLLTEVFDGSTYFDTTAYTPTANTWFWLAQVYDDVAHTVTFIVNGSVIGSVTVDLTSVVFPETDQSCNQVGAWSDESVAYLREWQSALTVPQLTAEASSPTPVISTGLLTNTPLSAPSYLTDTVAGRNWTATGTPTYLTGPLPPVNTTAANATVISSLPYTETLNATDAPQGATYHPPCRSEAQHSVWWKWTCPLNVTFMYFGADIGTGAGASYFPYTSAWTGPNSASLTIISTSESVDYCQYLAEGPFYFRLVTTPGETYWFQVVTRFAVDVPAVVTVRAQLPPNLTAAAGSFVVCDDITPFPAAIISPDGTYRQFRPFPSGERAATMPDGSVCTQNGAGDFTGIAILDRDWNTIATQDFGGTRILRNISSDQSNYFYVTTIPSGTPIPYDSNLYVLNRTTGAIVHTVPLTVGITNTPYACAPSPDGTTFYVALGQTNTIDVWDIASATLITTWTVALPSGYVWGQTGDGWTISDGSIFFPSFKAASPDKIVRLNPANGAILDTYTGSATVPNSIYDHSCYISDAQFGMWRVVLGTPTLGYLQVIDIATGAHVSESVGLGVTSNSVVSTLAGEPNAISNSCPLFVIAESITPPPPTPTETFTDLVIRRMRRTPHLNKSHKRVTFNSFEILAQVGEGLLEGQGVDPQICLRWSDDGGRTWSREHWTTLGKIGEYRTRVLWRRLGQARDRVFEVVVSDPVEASLITAYVDAAVGSS